jgi:hypothetical protein
MSKAGKMIKGMLKAKKESVMGKLANGDDPMEPWSKRFDAPIKEDEQLDESDPLLFKYIRSLGWEPKHMDFATRSKYARSNAFKNFKVGHTADPKERMEESENLDEAGTGLLMSYIKAKGLDPRLMDGNQKASYSRSSEFQKFKNRHVKEVSGMGERGDDWNEEKKPKAKKVQEAVDEKDTVTMDIPLLIRVLEYAREDAKTDMDLHKVVENLINMRGQGALSMDMYNKIVAIKEEIEKIDELSKGTLTSYATKARADASNLSKQGDAASKRTSSKSMQTALDKFRKATKRHMGAASAESKARLKEGSDDNIGKPAALMKPSAAGMAAAKKNIQTQADRNVMGQAKIAGAVPSQSVREEKLDELKKQSDTQELDSVIAREDLRKWFSKTDPEGGWKRINSKGEAIGPCAREPGEPKPKCMSNEKRAKLSKKERAAAVAAKRKHDPVADRPSKGGKPVNVSNFGKGKLGEDVVDEACWDTHKQEGMKKKGNRMVPNCVPKNEEVEQVNEKNSPTNSKLWARAKSMARSKFDVYPSAYANGWASKWYKSKGGGWRATKEDVELQEGIYGIEDSPMSATNSVKAMESAGRRKKEMSKSARMIKAIYKKKNVKETMYDWEKSEKGAKPTDEPTAKVIMKGGTTMTGKPRDTIEIGPVLRTKLNSPAGNKPSV